MRWRTGAIGVLLASLLAVAPAPAGAQGEDVGFSISAERFPSYFRYRLAAGDTATGAVLVRSQSPRGQSIVLQAVDVATAATGGLQYGSERPAGTGTWFELARRRITVPAGSSVRVPFTARVPSDAAAGDHLAGIVAINRRTLRQARKGSDGEGFALRFLPRLAIATSVQVPGARDPRLALGRAGIDVTPSGAAITLLLRNVGNTMLSRVTGRLTVMQGDRELDSRAVQLGAFVPHTSITYRVPFRGAPTRGTYRIVGTLQPHGAPEVAVDETVEFGDSAARELDQESGIEARGGTSPLVWLVMGLAFAGVVALATAYWRARRALRLQSR